MQIDALSCCKIMIYFYLYIRIHTYTAYPLVMLAYLWYLKRTLCRLDLVVLGWLEEQYKLDPVTAVRWQEHTVNKTMAN